MKIIISGCSRLGAHLATRLDHAGHDINIIDRQSTAFNRLETEFSGNSIVGTAIDEDILDTAGINTCDVFIAVTESDNTNLMAAQIALKLFHVPKVAARVYDPIRAQIFGGMGILTISPTTKLGDAFLDKLEFTREGADECI